MINGVSAIQSGFNTVKQGVGRLDKAASELSLAYLPLDDETQAALGPDKPDVVGSLVEMMLARRQVEIGAKVIDRASQTEQSLLDIIA
jgi:hypothetical protein